MACVLRHAWRLLRPNRVRLAARRCRDRCRWQDCVCSLDACVRGPSESDVHGAVVCTESQPDEGDTPARDTYASHPASHQHATASSIRAGRPAPPAGTSTTARDDRSRGSPGLRTSIPGPCAGTCMAPGGHGVACTHACFRRFWKEFRSSNGHCAHDERGVRGVRQYAGRGLAVQ